MIFSDSTSSQAAHRQRRIAADEKLRVDKIANDAAVREGVVRQAGEMPARGEVDRFRALMQERAGAQTAGSKQPQQRPGSSTRNGDPVPTQNGGEQPSSAQAGVSAYGIADRFRALFAQSPDAAGATPDDSSAETEAGTAGRRQADALTDAASAETPRPTDAEQAMRLAASNSSDASKPMATSTPKSADAATAEESDAHPAEGHKSNSAESSQQLALRAARGEVPVGAAARNARSGTGKDDGTDDKDSASSRMAGAVAPSMMPGDSGSLMPAQRMGPDGPQQAQVTAGMIAPGLAELLEKHVKQLLVSDSRGSRQRSREVLLRMQSDILPGTDLWLTRTNDGWQLRADVRSRDAYDTLLANQDELVQRFADRALGQLSVEPVFHGEAGAVAGLPGTANSLKR